MSVLSALLQTIIGACAVVVGVLISNHGNRKLFEASKEADAREKQVSLRRERGEELYELVDIWLNNLGAFYLRRNALMQGKLTYDQIHDMDIQDGNPQFKFGRIEMIIDVYFSNIRHIYDNVVDNRSELNSIEIEFKKSYERGESASQDVLRRYVLAQKGVEKAGSELKESICDVLRNA